MFENSLIVVNIKLDNARWFLRGLNKPFDPFAQKAMHDTMIGIANCTEAVWAFNIIFIAIYISFFIKAKKWDKKLAKEENAVKAESKKEDDSE